MAASLENPIYTAYVVSGDKKYTLNNVLLAIDFSDQQNQFSKSATLHLVNIKTSDGYLSSLIKVRDRVYIYANDGERSEEVFRGFVWTRSYKSSLDGHELALRCYDNLIYMQESEDSQFFASGKSTKDVVQSICDAWGVKLEYSYESITHSKLALRGYISDILIDDVLDLVKDRTGKKYVILSEKDTLQIKSVGSNTTVYTIKAGQNATDTTSECTMDGMITKVVILGKADDDDREPVEATVEGDTGTYGTLQKIIDRDENTSLADAKKEAQSIIDEKGTPKWEYTINAPDVPWIRKGDKVKVSAGDITTPLIITGIDRDIGLTKKTMALTLERITAAKAKTDDSSSGDKPELNRVLRVVSSPVDEEGNPAKDEEGNPLIATLMNGEDVRWLQERLTELGYDCGEVDGVYGAKTAAAVKQFQKAKSLAQDGMVGPLTWAEL